MEIIIYSYRDNPQRDKLLKEVSQVSNLTHIMTFDFRDLFQIIKSKLSDQVVIVFLISSAKELECLILNKERLFNSRYILILPNGDEDFISLGLSLYPRYIAYTDNGFLDVAAVLDKMVRNKKNSTTINPPMQDGMRK